MGFRVSALKGVRWVVWLLLAWILLRGIVSIVAPPPAAKVEAQTPPAPVVREPDREAPGAFAALFAREYLTWQAGKESDRAQRLQPLLDSHLDPQAGWSAGPTPSDQQVAETWPFKITPVGDTRWLVTVAARVATKTEKQSLERTLYLAVPVAAGTTGGYLVSDYPTLVPAPQAGALKTPAPAGEELADAGGQVRTLLTGFFRAYAAGGADDVTYYLEPGVRVPGLQGSLHFNEVTDLSLRRNGQETTAQALVTWEDPVTGSRLRQRYTLKLVQRDGRWYIQELMEKGA